MSLDPNINDEDAEHEESVVNGVSLQVHGLILRRIRMVPIPLARVAGLSHRREEEVPAVRGRRGVDED